MPIFEPILDAMAELAFEDIALSRRLKRLGDFVVLRETVMTSGRNLRASSVSDALQMLKGLALHGPRYFRDRRGLDFWYASRRDDSDTPAAVGSKKGSDLTKDEQ